MAETVFQKPLDKQVASNADAIATLNSTVSTGVVKQKRFSKTLSPNGTYTINFNNVGTFVAIISGRGTNIERGLILHGYMVNKYCCAVTSPAVYDYSYTNTSQLVTWARNENNIVITNGTSLDVLVQVIIMGINSDGASAS